MARVPDIPSNELPADLASIYERFARQYGPFRNQAAVFAHVPAGLRHLMSMLLELREAATLPKRVLELAIVTVSRLNECDYCVAHHTPFLVVEGVSAAGVEHILDYRDHQEFLISGTSSSSNTRSSPGSGRTVSPMRFSTGCASISATLISSS